MSVVNKQGEKVIVSRGAGGDFWDVVYREYAGEDPLRWKYLAMLVLQEHCGWSLEQLGRAFDRDRGHVSRSLQKLKRELRETFRRLPEWDLDNPFRPE